LTRFTILAAKTVKNLPKMPLKNLNKLGITYASLTKFVTVEKKFSVKTLTFFEQNSIMIVEFVKRCRFKKGADLKKVPI